MSYKGKRHDFVSNKALYEQMKTRTVEILSEAIQEQGDAFIALSGGSTPKGFFELLCGADLAWEKVFITLVDERWVDPQETDSNEYLVRNFLMKGKAAKANFIGLKSDKERASEGVGVCNQCFQAIDKDFDLVILGMGEDGHTASFFPGAEALESALTSDTSCVAITPPEAKYERMTLTLSRLLRTKNIFLHIEGNKKSEVLKQALEEGSVEAMPIRAFIHRKEKPYLEVFYAEQKT